VSGLELDKVLHAREILAEMDIPIFRKDLRKLSNLSWLARNVSIRNGNHPKLNELLSILREIRKEQR
jgi:hypothetical protein